MNTMHVFMNSVFPITDDADAIVMPILQRELRNKRVTCPRSHS